MLRVVILSVLVAFAIAKDCTPTQTGFYWEPKCPNQKFDNLIAVNNLSGSQNGVSLLTAPGLNISQSIDITLDITDNYGTITKPLITIDIYAYSGTFSCGWTKQPTFGMLSNLDGCTIIPADQCHLTGNPKTVSASINLKTLMGTFESLVTVGDYYGLAVTVLDNDKPLACAWAQDKVIAK